MVGKQAKKEANSNYVTGSRVRIMVKEGVTVFTWTRLGGSWKKTEFCAVSYICLRFFRRDLPPALPGEQRGTWRRRGRAGRVAVFGLPHPRVTQEVGLCLPLLEPAGSSQGL